MAVDFAPTMRVIEAKLTADMNSLKAILTRSSSSIRDFAEQKPAARRESAGVHAIDVLSGRTNLTGHPSHAGFAAAELASAPAAGLDKDAAEISAMAKRLAPKPASV